MLKTVNYRFSFLISQRLILGSLFNVILPNFLIFEVSLRKQFRLTRQLIASKARTVSAVTRCFLFVVNFISADNGLEMLL